MKSPITADSLVESLLAGEVSPATGIPDFKRFEIGGNPRNGHGYETECDRLSPRCIETVEKWLGQFGEVGEPVRDRGPDGSKVLRWEVGSRGFYAMKPAYGNVCVFEDTRR